MSRRQAAELRSDPDFHRDVTRLVDKLRLDHDASRGTRARRARVAAGTGLVLAAAALALVARSPGSPTAPGDGEAGTASTTATTANPAGTGPSCEGDADGVLTFGALLPRTGDWSHHAPVLAAAVTLAVADVNRAGGVLGHDVALVQGDAGDGNPDIATATVRELSDAGADVFLDASNTRVSFAVIDMITGGCRIQFSPSAASSSLTSYDDRDLFFRTVPSNTLQGRAVAELAQAEGGGTAAILHRRDGYGETLGRDIAERFEAGGGDLVLDRGYDPDAKRFDVEVGEVVASDPDVLFVVGYGETSAILQALFDEGFVPGEKRIYLVDGNLGDWLGEGFGPGELAGIKGTLPGAGVPGDLGWRLDDIVGPGTDVPAAQRHQYAPEAYDAVVITALATVRAGTDEPAAVARRISDVTRGGTRCDDFATCAELIAGGGDVDYDGRSGPLAFNDAGEPTIGTYRVATYGDGNKLTSIDYRTVAE